MSHWPEIQLFQILSHQTGSKSPTMANFVEKVGYIGSKWPILGIWRFFSKMRLRFTRNGQFHMIHSFSHLLPEKHLISAEISDIFILEGGYIAKFSKFFNFFNSFDTKLAQNYLQWWFLPKKSVRLAQNGQFWSFCRFLPIIAHNFFSYSTFSIPSHQTG